MVGDNFVRSIYYHGNRHKSLYQQNDTSYRHELRRLRSER